MALEGVHDEVANAVGYLVMGFNDLEIAAGGAIMRLLKQEEKVGQIFVGLLSFSTKLQILNALAYKIDDPTVRVEFHQLLREANDINAERNRLIHAEYRLIGDSDDSYKIVTRRLRDSHKADAHLGAKPHQDYASIVNSGALNDLANDAAILADKMLEFSVQFNPGGA